MIRIATLALGPLGTNCYICFNDATRHALIFDPGGEGEKVIQFLTDENIIPIGIVLTHGHGDHIGGAQALVDKYGIPIYIHEDDVEMLSSPTLNLSIHMGVQKTLDGDLVVVKDGDKIKLDSTDFTVLETPGHTPGGVSYYADGIVVVGDTLFQSSIGRTDFPKGSYEQLLKSITTKLYTLPGDTIVLPGHGPSTTIVQEMNTNPYTLGKE